MELDIDVVNIDITLLFRLPTLGKYKLYVNNVKDVLICTNPKWEHLISRKSGHLFYEWECDIMYTENQPLRMHRHFYHPRPERLFNLLKRADDENANAETYTQLQNISQECDICQRFSEQPGRFRVSILGK